MCSDRQEPQLKARIAQLKHTAFALINRVLSATASLRVLEAK